MCIFRKFLYLDVLLRYFWIFVTQSGGVPSLLYVYMACVEIIYNCRLYMSYIIHVGKWMNQLGRSFISELWVELIDNHNKQVEQFYIMI